MIGEHTKFFGKRDAEIFFVSVLILYLELVLIRWIGTEIRIFAYLGNLILVVSFFGTGLGCYLVSRPVALTRLGVHLMVLTGLVTNPLHLESLDLKKVTDWLAGFEDSPLWSFLIAPNIRIAGGLAAVGVMLYLVLFVFVPLGQILGRSIGQHPRAIQAYSVNIAGSLAGIWLFNTLSWFSTTPVTWFCVLAVLVVASAGIVGWRGWGLIVTLGVTICLVWVGRPHGTRTIWSPYQKLEVVPTVAVNTTAGVPIGEYCDIVANGAGFQRIQDLSDRYLLAHPELYDPEQARLSHYNLAFQFKQDVRRLLVVGAGAGNNAAAALRHGVEQIDCIEIDPQIYALGKELHPERPYDSPRVHMYVTDARAFLKRAAGPYDMIWFGLLDTQPGSSYNNRPLDQYVYTIQSFQEAQHLLAPNGVLVVNFAARRPWIADRLYGMLAQVFGRPPLAFHLGFMLSKYGTSGELTLVTGNKPLTLQNMPDSMERDYLRSHLITELQSTTRPTTDDWPYLYLQDARIPRLHWWTSLILLGIVALASRRTFGVQARVDWHYFFLGAAFLLLEVQTVSRATLLFGMTWKVNAIVISAVLMMILLANLVAWRWPRFPQWLIVMGLAASVAALAIVPLDSFNSLTGATKLVAASAFLTTPAFFGGLIFIRSFAGCADKSHALGSNLIGALVGGLLESVSFITGIRALVVLVGAFYILALCLKPRVAQNAQPGG